MAFRKPSSPYTVVSNRLAQDEEISAGCLGVLVYLMSRPDGWKGRNADLERRFKIGSRARREIVKEAERHGYLKYVRMHIDGKLDCYYEIQFDQLPPDQRTDSSKAVEVQRESAEDQPPHFVGVHNEGVHDEGVQNVGAIKERVLDNKELQSKEGKSPPRLLTEEELRKRTGSEVTADESEAAQEFLFLSTGKAWCVHQYPKCLAFIQNIKLTRGANGVSKLLQAMREPDKFGISRTWAKWEIEEALWPQGADNHVKDAILGVAVARYRRWKSEGNTERDFLILGTDIPQAVKREAIRIVNEQRGRFMPIAPSSKPAASD